MTRLTRSLLAAVATLVLSLPLVACGEKPDAESAHIVGHMLTDELSGIALDLPAVWAGRYRVSDAVTAVTVGLQRELTLRLVRGDSGLVASPLVIVRVFEAAAWTALPPDSAAHFGIRIAENASHTLVLAMAPENPLPASSADALAFDTLMIALNQRPLRARLRADSR